MFIDNLHSEFDRLVRERELLITHWKYATAIYFALSRDKSNIILQVEEDLTKMKTRIRKCDNKLNAFLLVLDHYGHTIKDSKDSFVTDFDKLEIEVGKANLLRQDPCVSKVDITVDQAKKFFQSDGAKSLSRNKIILLCVWFFLSDKWINSAEIIQLLETLNIEKVHEGDIRTFLWFETKTSSITNCFSRRRPTEQENAFVLGKRSHYVYRLTLAGVVKATKIAEKVKIL